MELLEPVTAPPPALAPLAVAPGRSALAGARLHRKLTVEEAAKRAGIPPDHVTWLEEGRVLGAPGDVDHAQDLPRRFRNRAGEPM